MKPIIIFALSLLCLLPVISFSQKSAIFNTAEGAIHGYDPVGYFTEGKPVKGNKQFHYEWNSVTWYFVNQQNLNTFKTNPEKFAPQYGGYCAYGLANGHKAPTDPQAWLIANDKLYLNYNKNVQQKWKEKQADNIHSADKQWPALKDKE